MVEGHHEIVALGRGKESETEAERSAGVKVRPSQKKPATNRVTGPKTL